MSNDKLIGAEELAKRIKMAGEGVKKKPGLIFRVGAVHVRPATINAGRVRRSAKQNPMNEGAAR